MPGIKFLSKDNYVTLNYVINQLLKPELKKALFDDYMGISEITAIIYSGNTAVYGVFHKGLPEPCGVMFFTGVVPYRDCYLYSCIFDKEDRKKGIINEIIPKVKNDIQKRFAIHSVSANIIGKNDASKYILEKMGFKKVGVKSDYLMINGDYKDLQEYYMILDGGG